MEQKQATRKVAPSLSLSLPYLPLSHSLSVFLSPSLIHTHKHTFRLVVSTFFLNSTAKKRPREATDEANPPKKKKVAGDKVKIPKRKKADG